MNTQNITIERRGNRREKVYRKRKGMEKMIIVGSWVSAKCGNLMSNSRGSQCWHIRERLFRKVVSSIGGNRCSALLDNRIIKEPQPNLLHVEEYFARVPTSEAIGTEAEVIEIDINDEPNIDNDLD